jgi:hypothetical protein
MKTLKDAGRSSLRRRTTEPFLKDGFVLSWCGAELETIPVQNDTLKKALLSAIFP